MYTERETHPKTYARTILINRSPRRRFAISQHQEQIFFVNKAGFPGAHGLEGLVCLAFHSLFFDLLF